MREYQAVYSEAVAEFILSLTKRRQRKLVDTCMKLARHPMITADYIVKDADGREIEHLLAEGFVIAYWLDVPVRQLMIVEVDDVE